tara:strand:+ start:850 stop:1464 length:615 start_codon:yes stop_codon:yes gene_type:complete
MTLKIDYVPVSDLLASEYNPRRLSKKQYEDIQKSLEEFGLVEPIIVNSNPDRKNIIIGGHQRWHVFRNNMKQDKIPVHYVDLSEEAEKELNIRLNKNSGTFDYEILLGSGHFDEADLLDWGFTEKDFEIDLDIDDIEEPILDQKDAKDFKDLTITLSKEQLAIVEEELEKVMSRDTFKYAETYANTDAKGNALYSLCLEIKNNG